MQILNKYFFYYLIILLAPEISFAQNVSTYGNESQLIGKNAPSFTYYSYEGKEITLNQYKGKMLLLDFWESWCSVCIRSFPEINRIAIEYKNKGIEVLGITTENKKMVKKLIKKNKLVYINLFADKIITLNYKISSRPTYILVNEEGIIIFISYGNLEIIENKLKQILG